MEILPYRQHANTSASRFGEATAGAVLGVIGLLFGGITIFGVFRSFSRASVDTGAVVILGILGFISVFCLITGYRLVVGRGRKSDGGLFAPWFLRLMGLLFLVASAAFIYLPEGHIIHVGTSLTLAFGCFYLANRQQRARQTLSQSSNDI
jgi:hypothetical protein